jgi:hypothetical protein
MGFVIVFIIESCLTYVAALAYLSYRGWVEEKWAAMEDASKSTLTNTLEQVVHAFNNTTTQFALASVCCCGIRPTSSSYGWICTRTNDGVEEGLEKTSQLQYALVMPHQ